ncbi:hypothetical protein [Granulicoccus sp. GXG6511]|uniref:hypothetical protein n=1 Tax=Granulicoccus sp. GXG6511 TaxID=3381351 RepID=UPI003D7CC975
MIDSAVGALLEGHWYDALAALLHDNPPKRRDEKKARRAYALATAAKRVLDLDAEDFGTIAKGFSAPWANRLRQSCFPLEPRDQERGALRSLVPLYELMLEVTQLRALRHEPLQVVVTAHLIGEYLCQLAWEPILGHGGDPLKMGRSVGQRWGTDDPLCPHNSAMRATAKRSLNACNGDLAGYTAYLDKFHSRLGDTLAVCAMNHETVGAGERPDVGETCPNPCKWATAGSLELRRDLDARVRLALLYVDSPIVSLRHHAPVGHFFGVPSVQEISDAWLRTWTRLTQPWNDGANPLLAGGVPGAAPPDEALPGLSQLVSTVAGRTIGPGRVIRSIGDEIVATLEEDL